MAVFTKKKEALVDTKIATIISQDCIIEGKIQAEGSVRIDGEVIGDVHVKQGIVLGTSGKITGNVTTSELVSFGTLLGDVKAEVIEIKASGSIQGDVYTTQMSMEFGAKHNGRVSMDNANSQKPLNNKALESSENY
jgi:cytoskeletal protein CcmA (bactofilin family)